MKKDLTQVRKLIGRRKLEKRIRSTEWLNNSMKDDLGARKSMVVAGAPYIIEGE